MWSIQRLEKRGGEMRDNFIIIPGQGSTEEEKENWKAEFIKEGSILNEFFKLFRVKKNWCGRCKRKLERREDGRKWCPNCGSTYINDGSLITPE
jgi:hypothetical protein